MSAQDQEIQVKRRLPRFGQVPDAILEDRALSLETRAVLAYLVGRSDGYRVTVGRLCFALGIKDARWRRIRREMEAARYFQQRRIRRDDGTFGWRNDVFDTPNDPTTIPPKSTDGGATDGGAIHGKPTDLPEGVNHTETTIRSREARASRAGADAQRARASPASRSAGRFSTTAEGITVEAGNDLDADNLTRIRRHPPAAVASAVAAAAAQDGRGRAFASAVARALDPPRRLSTGSVPAWATSGVVDQSDAATSDWIEGSWGVDHATA